MEGLLILTKDISIASQSVDPRVQNERINREKSVRNNRISANNSKILLEQMIEEEFK